ncbi:MAG: DUF1501 domain-containing protein [Planctomycetota bacterium]
MCPTRREFLKATLGASTLASFGWSVPAFLVRSAVAAGQSPERDTVLVVVQLSGGNDGLNTVVPYDSDEYARSRPTLRLPAGEVHRINGSLGFHPRMGGFKRLYDEGYLSILQGVGYPNQNRDHDRAMRDWHSAAPSGSSLQTGWLGRVVDASQEGVTGAARETNVRGAAGRGAFVGRIATPFALSAAKTVVPSVHLANELVLEHGPALSAYSSGWTARSETARADDNALLGFLRQETQRAVETSQRVEAAAKAAVDYPPFELAADLRTVAQLIRAEVGFRIFLTELGGGGIGGFDNHANQLGNHCAVLHELSESVAAFVHDLARDGLLDRVLLMTFSEFGRTLAENGRRGTDHGAAAPLFLAGSKVRGGLIGSHPSLTDLDQGALRFHTDFRRVYATVLESWLGMPSRPVLGAPFEVLDVLRV